MVEWSIEVFRGCDSVVSIVVAAPPGQVGDLAGHDLGVVPGGATRAQSVANALEMDETEAEEHLDSVIIDAHNDRNGAAV